MLDNWILSRLYCEGEPPVDPPKTFTQDEVNAMMAEHKRGLQAKLNETSAELEKIKKAGGNSEGLTKKVKELNDLLLTREELAKKDAEEAKTKHDSELKATRDASAQWEQRFMNTFKSTQIVNAASKHDAFDLEQLTDILDSKTKVIEVLDAAGNGTGAYKVMTTLTVDGKKLELPVDEAVGKMRDLKQYANQFKQKGSGGTGLTLNNFTPAEDPNGPPTDPAKFMEWHKKNRTRR